jgi:hypothetical protein
MIDGFLVKYGQLSNSLSGHFHGANDTGERVEIQELLLPFPSVHCTIGRVVPLPLFAP